MDFRVKGPTSQSTLRGVPAEKPIETFLDEIATVARHEVVRAGKPWEAQASGVPRPCVQLLAGFPPKALELPKDRSATVSSLGLRSGESLIVREVEPEGARGIVVRRVIEADNSCLFNAVGYVREKLRGEAPALRKIVAERIAADPERYCEAFLAKPNADYCDWILQANNWGGAIELSVLAEHFQCEIAAYDICSMRRDLHGEGQGYKSRYMLIYDGIHYDALALAADKGAPEAADFTVFEVGPEADLADIKARTFVAEQNKQRQFTDTGNFTLRCCICQAGLKGEADARAHASSTGHQNFAEY